MGFSRLNEGALEHKYSGIHFPKKTVNFSRKPIQNFDRAGKNVGVGYTLEKENCHTTFTVYVYPKNGSNLENEFENVKESIQYIYRDADVVNESNAYLFQDSLEVKGLTITYKIPAMYQEHKFYLFSQAHLFEHKGNFLKYRITYPEFYKSCTERAVHQLLNQIDWDTP
jgi:hypothetical protein